MLATEMGPGEAEAYRQLSRWARVAGGRAYPSSMGFRLPDGSVSTPDAAWLSPERLAALPAGEKDGASQNVCPDVVIEVMSESERWLDVVEKLQRFIKNGARFAIAIDTHGRQIALGKAPQGLVLDFEAIFDP